MNKAFQLLDVQSVDGRRVVILPDDIAHALSAEDGGQVVATWDDDGSMTLASAGSDFDIEMAVARQIMRNDRVVPHELARC